MTTPREVMDPDPIGHTVRFLTACHNTGAPIGAAGRPNRGAAYENQPEGAAGGPLGPDGAPEGLWWRRGVPRGSQHQSCTDTGQLSDPSDDYMLRAALEGTHFCSAKTDMPQNLTYFLVFIVTRQTAMPIQIVPRFCARGYGRFEKLLYRCQNPSR